MENPILEIAQIGDIDGLHLTSFVQNEAIWFFLLFLFKLEEDIGNDVPIINVIKFKIDGMGQVICHPIPSNAIDAGDLHAGETIFVKILPTITFLPYRDVIDLLAS